MHRRCFDLLEVHIKMPRYFLWQLARLHAYGSCKLRHVEWAQLQVTTTTYIVCRCPSSLHAIGVAHQGHLGAYSPPCRVCREGVTQLCTGYDKIPQEGWGREMLWKVSAADMFLFQDVVMSGCRRALACGSLPHATSGWRPLLFPQSFFLPASEVYSRSAARALQHEIIYCPPARLTLRRLGDLIPVVMQSGRSCCHQGHRGAG